MKTSSHQHTAYLCELIIVMMLKYSLLCFIAMTLAIGCSTKNNKTMKEEQKNDPNIQNNIEQDSIPRVTGIGGIFFFSDNPEKTRQWYADHLGLAVNEWGSSFEFRNANRPDEINYLQWSPFKQGSAYFQPSEKEFMINYRVQHIEKLVENLRNKGVTILDSIETFDYGKFVHIMDADGNKIELWEPVDQVFTEMGGETTK